MEQAIPLGTLDLLILKTLKRLNKSHGYGIAQYIKATTESVLQVEEGSLYPALQRLRLQGWVKATWGLSENNRKARYYTLTTAGQRQLQRELDDYTRVSAAILQVIRDGGTT